LVKGHREEGQAMKRDQIRNGLLVGMLGLLVFGAALAVVAQEDITLTTYYPSPRGVYEELRVTRNAFLATDPTAPVPVVSIGTDTPPPGSTATLYVLGSAEADAFRAFETSGVYAFIEAGPDDGWAQIGGWNAAVAALAPTYLDAAPLAIQTRPGSTNVGIGTATTHPSNKLEVEGRVAIGAGYAGGGNPAPTNGLIVQGDVGIGTATPGARLEVNGESRFRGDVRLLAGSAFQCNQSFDIAENMVWLDTTHRAPDVGDVVVVDPHHDEGVSLTSRAYDPAVAGIISDAPGLLLGAALEGKTVALIGRVPTKVTAENGPVRRGDLLVTASKPGFAMRGDPKEIQSGMVIGKALGELEEGEGTIVVLVNLQ
jgi:hypothetical protein